MSLPRYERYKDSGVEWLGEVPEHWEVKKLIFLLDKLQDGTHFSPENKISGDYLYITAKNVKEWGIDLSDVTYVNKEAHTEIYKRCPVCRGDVLYIKDGATAGIAAINTINEQFSLLSSVAMLRPKSNCYSPNFLAYHLNTKAFKQFILNSIVGGAMSRFTIEIIRKFRLVVPPFIEQQAIAAFLGTETAKIDALIAEQQKLIELLKEKRQAVISHAVTKGLNPDAKMKDSGIEWLGEVPDHWGVVNIRRITVKVHTGGTPTTEQPCQEIENGICWYTPGDFDDSLILCESVKKVSQRIINSGEAKYFPTGSVLIVSIGATLGKVGYIKNAASANQQINALIPSENIDGYFLAYSLFVKIEQMKFLSNASTIGIMNQEKTKEIYVAVPPTTEQIKITQFLDLETKKIDALLLEAQGVIDLLQERRTALISAAVTGKIDVRGLVGPQEREITA